VRGRGSEVGGGEEAERGRSPEDVASVCGFGGAAAEGGGVGVVVEG
jgi:hypothetical protein